MKALETILKLEWAGAAAAALLVYGVLHGSWWLFAVLLLAPDLSMLGYLLGPRAGAFAYNFCHVLFWPAGLLAMGLLGTPMLIQIALIWFVHIAMDRALGYGLKLPNDFRDTHLGRIGRS